MVESNRPETSTASANLVMQEFCSHELTRSNSDAASSLTAENARPDKCLGWTDEKHNKYLGSLEASFVRQLHQSRGFLAWCTDQNRSGKDSSHRLPASVSKTSQQFRVLQDGQWRKLVFGKHQPLSYISTVKIPRMHCQRHAGKDTADPKECHQFHCEEVLLERKRAFSSRSALSSGHPCYYDSVVTDSAEGSGQNFADEDCKQDRNAISLAKRLKTAVLHTSSEDQIVPSGKFFALGRSIIDNTTLEGRTNDEENS